MLRNSCIKEIAPVFFAYSRDKYEELTLTNLQDYLTFPQELLDDLMDGKWTVSIKGNAYHNLAIDEGHECLINRRLKQITSRPSHFRTVQLADFMAYLDVLLRGVEHYVSRNKAMVTDKNRRGYVLQRANRINQMTPIKTIFDSLSRVLSNVFVRKPKKLDSMQRKDLMNIITIGTKRLHTFMKQYILHTEPTTKRKRQRIRTFTNTTKTQTQAKTESAKKCHHYLKELISTSAGCWYLCCSNSSLPFSISRHQWQNAYFSKEFI